MDFDLGDRRTRTLADDRSARTPPDAAREHGRHFRQRARRRVRDQLRGIRPVRDRALRFHRCDGLRRYRYPGRGTPHRAARARAKLGRARAGSRRRVVSDRDADGGESSLVAMDAYSGVGDGSRRAAEDGQRHPGKRPLAARRRKRHHFGQQLLRRFRKPLSTSRDHGPVLLVAGQYRGQSQPAVGRTSTWSRSWDWRRARPAD